MGARDDSSKEPFGNRPLPMHSSPLWEMRRSVSNSTGEDKADKSFGVAQKYSPGSQKAGFLVLGVVPLTVSRTLPIQSTRHPFGIGPNSESSNSLGNSAAVSASIPLGSRPAALAWTGSKSTNHDLKIASATDSRVRLVSRSRARRQSIVHRKSAIAFCSGKEGKASTNSLTWLPLRFCWAA